MYDDFYRLSGKPFQLSPDHRFFFKSKIHNRAMAYLRYGLEQGEGFIVVTGGIGTGKTMLVRNLFSELDTRRVIATQLVTTQVEAEDVLRMVCASFGLAHEGADKATLLRNLETFFRARNSEGKRVLLVVDEAQNLPARSVEELRMLSNFQNNGRALLQTFLLGQEQFKHTLKTAGMEQFRQRITASYHLQALDKKETQQYVEHRLKCVNWSGDPKFKVDAIDEIYSFTQGVPRRVNVLCDRLMLHGCLEHLHTFGRDAVAAVTTELNQEGWKTSNDESAGEVPTIADAPAGASTPPVEAVEVKPAAVPEPAAEEPVRSIATEEIILRLAALEKEIRALKKSARKDRSLLRKAILIQLAEMDFD